MTVRRRRVSRLGRVMATLVAAGLILLSSGAPVAAHGKEVAIEATSLGSDPSAPLTRLYRAVVTYADGDAVEDAVMVLRAVREEDGTIVGPVTFAPLDQPGRYVAEVDLVRFGTWKIFIQVTEPGEGIAEFVDAVLPGAGDTSADDGGSPQPESLSVLFGFDAGDWTNVAVRVAHSLAAAMWVGLIGVAIVGCCFTEPGSRQRTLGLLKRFLVPVATVSLVLILASGLHTATWGTPINEPGVFDLSTLLDIPFGGQYVVALAAMALAWALMVIVSMRLRAGLQAWTEAGEAGVAQVKSAAFAGLAIMIFLAVDITVLLYLHNISHLSLVIPQ